MRTFSVDMRTSESAMTSTEPVTSPLMMSGRSLTPAVRICSARPSRETRLLLAFETEHFDRGRGTGFGDGAATIVEHGANLTEGVADDVALVDLERTVLDEHGSDSAATAIQLRFQHRTHSLAARSRFQLLGVGNETDHLQQVVEANLLLG
jgi:hypothetical protein